jgi:hypothetical protein
LILRAAPFPWTQRILLVFSYYLSYEYAAISRNYAIGILLVTFALTRWRSATFRLAVPLALALSMQTSLHMAVIGGLLLVYYILEARSAGASRAVVKGSAVAALSLSIVIVQLWPSADAQFAPAALSAPRWAAISWALRGMLLPNVPIEVPLLWLPGAFFIVIVAASLWRDRSGFLLLVLGLLLLFAIFVLVYSTPDGYRHFGLILFYIIAVLWLHRSVAQPPSFAAVDRPTIDTLLSGAFGALVILGGLALLHEVRYSFSGSREMAQYIAQQVPENTPIAAHPAAPASAVLPFLEGRQFWYPGERRFGTFMTWSVAYYGGEQIETAEALRRSAERFGDRPFLFLTNRYASRSALADATLLYRNQVPVFAKRDEDFSLYMIPQSAGRDLGIRRNAAASDWRTSAVPVAATRASSGTIGIR